MDVVKPRQSRPYPFTWTLRTIQMLGALLAASGLAVAINLFRMIEADMASHSASALGLGFLGMALPLLGLSALLLLPSTALFCFAPMRQRFRVVRYWFLLWCINLGLSALFLSVLGLFLWAFLTAPKIPAS